MKKFAFAAVAITLLAAPAYAQFSMGGGGEEGGRTRYSEEEKRREAEADKAYRNVIKNTKNQNQVNADKPDPWGNVRPATPAKTSR